MYRAEETISWCQALPCYLLLGGLGQAQVSAHPRRVRVNIRDNDLNLA